MKKDNVNKEDAGKKRKRNVIYNIFIFFFLAVAIGCALYIGIYFYIIHKNENITERLSGKIVSDSSALDENGEPVYVDMNLSDGSTDKILKKYYDIYTENNDFVGWLKIGGTDIDYPVMYTPEDEEYYIHKDFDGNYNFAGCLFIDTSSALTQASCSDNILIYGHNMKGGTMFHDLLKYEDEDFYKGHRYITFDTIYETGTYEVIGALRTEIYEKNDTSHYHYYEFFDAETKEEFDEYISFVKAGTPYETEGSAEYGDRLITLSTCAYHADEGRYIVVAKKIK